MEFLIKDSKDWMKNFYYTPIYYCQENSNWGNPQMRSDSKRRASFCITAFTMQAIEHHFASLLLR